MKVLLFIGFTLITMANGIMNFDEQLELLQKKAEWISKSIGKHELKEDVGTIVSTIMTISREWPKRFELYKKYIWAKFCVQTYYKVSAEISVFEGWKPADELGGLMTMEGEIRSCFPDPPEKFFATCEVNMEVFKKHSREDVYLQLKNAINDLHQYLKRDLMERGRLQTVVKKLSLYAEDYRETNLDYIGDEMDSYFQSTISLTSIKIHKEFEDYINSKIMNMGGLSEEFHKEFLESFNDYFDQKRNVYDANKRCDEMVKHQEEVDKMGEEFKRWASVAENTLYRAITLYDSGSYKTKYEAKHITEDEFMKWKKDLSELERKFVEAVRKSEEIGKTHKIEGVENFNTAENGAMMTKLISEFRKTVDNIFFEKSGYHLMLVGEAFSKFQPEIDKLEQHEEKILAFVNKLKEEYREEFRGIMKSIRNDYLLDTSRHGLQ